MRALLLAVLLASAALPAAGAALGSASEPGPGWVAWRVTTPGGWSLRVDLQAQVAGDFSGDGVFVLDASGRNLIESWGTTAWAPPPSPRARSDALGLDLTRQPTRALGTLSVATTITCPACPPQTLHVVALAGGDVTLASWTLEGERVSVAGASSGAGALALREEDLDAALDAEAAVAGIGARATVAAKDVFLARLPVGVFADEDGLLAPGLQARTPTGARTCACLFPDASGAPGAYRFEVQQVDAAGDAVLLLADVALPP